MMTLDEAIIQCEDRTNFNCSECAKEHKQIASWLRELKTTRESLNILLETLEKR